MNTIPEAQEINDLIKEYLRSLDMNQTIQSMDQQIKSNRFYSNIDKYTNKKNKKTQITKMEDQPRLCTLIKNVGIKSRRQINFEKQGKLFAKKYKQVLSAGKQVFAVTINLLQLLSSLKQAARSELAEAIQNYKLQLAKYHKVLTNQGKTEKDEVTEVVMLEHKTKLDKYVLQKNNQGISEVLLSFRVNALQIAPQLRKNLVYQLIRNDVFKIQDTQKFDFLLGMLDNTNPQLRYAIIALVSIVSSTLRGVEYLTFNGNMVIIQRIIKILKEQQQSSVLQRFCLALLQKCSIKQTVIPTFIEHDMINWLMAIIKKSTNQKIHQFSLDFGSALLANIIHTPSTLQYLERNITFAQHLMESMLKLIRDNIQVSVLMHLLICLSYLSKQQFKVIVENCNFIERISQFVEYYSQINTSQNQGAQIDKRTVLDLCAHMFHPKDSQLQNSQTMQLNELKTQDRIREYENEQGQLIFECFQDEI